MDGGSLPPAQPDRLLARHLQLGNQPPAPVSSQVLTANATSPNRHGGDAVRLLGPALCSLLG